jgi:hypothetical protein
VRGYATLCVALVCLESYFALFLINPIIRLEFSQEFRKGKYANQNGKILRSLNVLMVYWLASSPRVW